MFDAWRGYRQFSRLSDEERNIVFYAESGNDWHHFHSIIEHLTRHHCRQVVYLTSDRQDICFQHASNRLRCFYIGEGIIRTWLFQVLKADLFVLTMMDLHNLQLKRSLHPVHYLYLFHSPGSTHMVDHANSYDHYDSILCSGPHHVAEIRRREALANLAPKNLIEHGYQRIETLVEQAKHRTSTVPQKETAQPPVVLIAPTWGENSIINVCGEALVDELLQARFRVILRPHYQTLKLSAKLIDQLRRKFRDTPGFTFVEQMGESDSLFDSDLLICDWSAIALEYALALQKPVLFIDVPPRVRNPDWRDWEIPPMEIAIREQVGAVVAPEDTHLVPARIRQLLAEPDKMKHKLAVARERYLFNFGRSVGVATEAILQLAQHAEANRKARREERA